MPGKTSTQTYFDRLVAAISTQADAAEAIGMMDLAEELRAVHEALMAGEYQSPNADRPKDVEGQATMPFDGADSEGKKKAKRKKK